MHSLYEFCLECRPVLVKLHPLTVYRIVSWECAVHVLNATFVSFGLTIVTCSMINSLILACLWPLVFVLNNILTLGILRSAISHLPGWFLPLDLLSEYRIQYGAIGPLYVKSSYSTWIFCRGVSGFATDCPCGVLCRGLTTCLRHVCLPFGNRLLNNSWAVELTYWVVYFHFFYFDIGNCIFLDTSYHFSASSLLLK